MPKPKTKREANGRQDRGKERKVEFEKLTSPPVMSRGEAVYTNVPTGGEQRIWSGFKGPGEA